MEKTFTKLSPKSMNTAEAKIIETVDNGHSDKFFQDLVSGNLDEQTEKRLGELLLEGINSGPATPWTKKDIKEIKDRVVSNILAKRRGVR